MSADTAVPSGENPQAWNRYSYTFNNPLGYIDPDGHDPYWCNGDATCMTNHNSISKNGYGSFSLPQGTYVTEDVANEMFRDMADEPDIPFKFPADGCYGRAHRMIQRIAEEYDVDIDSLRKATIQINDPTDPNDRLTIYTEYVYEGINGNTIEWGYHVAPLLNVETQDGSFETRVIDPSLFEQPVSVKTWAQIMNNPDANVSIQDRHWFSPGNTNLDNNTANQITDLKLGEYLDICRSAGYCE